MAVRLAILYCPVSTLVDAITMLIVEYNLYRLLLIYIYTLSTVELHFKCCICATNSTFGEFQTEHFGGFVHMVMPSYSFHRSERNYVNTAENLNVMCCLSADKGGGKVP